MKRFLTILCTSLLLTAALCVTASASHFDSTAEELAAIGIFRGGADGFNLDQAPTRGQAAIMLVRLLGGEPEALGTYRSGRLTCPFTDVNETTAPYVAWLADQGVANGTSDTTFGAADPCTAQAYTVFLLRALGYQDNNDFTYSTAPRFAAGLGLLDTSALSGEFLRDDLAALTYQALATDLRDGSTYLLDSLIEKGAIKADAARDITAKIETYRALQAAGKKMGTGLAADITMDAAVTVSTDGTSGGQAISDVQHTNLTGKGSIQMILNQNPRMAYDLTLTASGVSGTPETQNVKMWMRDGEVYIQNGETAYKSDLGGLLDQYQDLMVPGADSSSGAAMLPFLESVAAESSGSDTVYTLQLNAAFASLLNSMLAQTLRTALPEGTGIPEGFAINLAMDGFTLKYTVSKDALKSADADMALSFTMNLDAGAGEQLKMVAGVVMNLEMDITATGDAVKIVFPDFSKFEDLPTAAKEAA